MSMILWPPPQLVTNFNLQLTLPPGRAVAGAVLFRGCVTQVGPGFFDFGFKLFDDVGMLRGDIGRLADVVDEIV